MAVLPVHNLPETKLIIERISHDNPYDYTRPHRHSYYELLLFETGGGEQTIDFQTQQIKGESCYLVLPRQIHLIKKAKAADGWLIQFAENQIQSKTLLATLKSLLYNGFTGNVFIEKKEVLREFIVGLMKINSRLSSKSELEIESAKYHFHTLLFDVLSKIDIKYNQGQSEVHRIFNSFMSLVEENIKERYSNAWFAEKLGVNEKKLLQVCKQTQGQTPLQIIHNHLLIEVKRELASSELTHKEIAFNYGFSDLSNYSNFIKTKLGLSPTELKNSLG